MFLLTNKHFSNKLFPNSLLFILPIKYSNLPGFVSIWQMDSPAAIASAEGGVQRQQNNGHLDQVQQQVNEVRTVMAQNVNRVLERGERLEHLDNRSQALQESSQSFTHTSHRVQRFMCMQSMKWTIIFGVFLSVMLLLGVLTLLRIFKVI